MLRNSRLQILLYLDPSSGGILIQVILGSVGGGLVLLKLFWHRLTSFTRFFRRQASKKTDTETPTDDH